MTTSRKYQDINHQTTLIEMKLLGSAAGRAFDKMIASIYAPVTLEWLVKYLKAGSQVSGLHVGCKDGSDTFLLAALLGGGCTLTAIDEDPALIEQAQLEKKYKRLEHIQFCPTGLADLATDVEFDFIFSRSKTQEFADQISEWEGMARQLRAGGILFFQVQDFTGFHSFPYNYAFARSVELIGKLGSPPLRDSNLKDLALEHLTAAGFGDFETTFSPPAFVPKENNHILSLYLEWRKAEIQTGALASREELNSLIQELKYYESQPDTLISRPGMYQIRARLKDD